MNNNVEINYPKRYYVYMLCRPDGRPFYIGKGSGRRAEQHLNEARRAECYCRKCKIIRRIWDSRKEVKIEYVFAADTDKEARQEELRLIHEWARKEHLCNRQGNYYVEGLPFVKPVHEMNFDEYVAWLKAQKLSAKERKREIMKWAKDRVANLERYRKAARLHGDTERFNELEQEIETLVHSAGIAYQIVVFY